MEDKALIVFIKNPELGRVKTRLAADLGEATALEIYLSLLDHTRKTAIGIEANRYIYYSRFIEEEDEWHTRHFQKALQAGTSLGQRMTNAFEEVLNKHEKAIIIGSDCPGINPDLIHLGFDLLSVSDVVLGPSIDGGYYLIGLKQPQPQLFTKMPWSSDKVLPETRKRLRESRLLWEELPVLADIDVANDWEQWGWPLSSTDDQSW